MKNVVVAKNQKKKKKKKKRETHNFNRERRRETGVGLSLTGADLIIGGEPPCVVVMPGPSGGPLDTATAVSAPAPAFEIDAAALASYLRSNVPSFPASSDAHSLRVLKFTHGQSNPTYLLQVCVCVFCCCF